MAKKYRELTRKQKQLVASEYPYKSDNQLFDATLGHGFESKKFFNNRKELLDFKEEAAQNDVSLQKRRDFVVGEKTTKNSNTISIIDAVLGDAGEDDYRSAIEIAQHEMDPLEIVKNLFGLQISRLRYGMKYEKEAGLGTSQETENTMKTALDMAKLMNDIINGKKLDVQIEGSLSSMIMGMNLDDIEMPEEEQPYIDIDIKEEENEDEPGKSV